MNRLKAGVQSDDGIARYERNDIHGILTIIVGKMTSWDGIYLIEAVAVAIQKPNLWLM